MSIYKQAKTDKTRHEKRVQEAGTRSRGSRWSLVPVSLTWVGTFPKHSGKVFVQQEVLNMAHLVVYSDQVTHCHVCTLLDSLVQMLGGKDS